jgi:FixJ family two-component response regulator
MSTVTQAVVSTTNTLNRSVIARKAVRTRRARQAFVARFGQQTLQVVTLVLNGAPTSDITELVNVSASSVAAIRANLTRNTYRPFVSKTGRGSANLNNVR